MVSTPLAPSAVSPTPGLPAPPGAEGLGVLLDLALEATAATGAALLVPEGEQLRVLQARGSSAPAADEPVALAGTVAGEAWYRGRLVTGAEPPPRGPQSGLWEADRTIEVLAAPIVGGERTLAVFVLYHRHHGHFRRNEATMLSRLAALAAGLWLASTGGEASAATARARLEVAAAARMAVVASGRFEEGEAWLEIARSAALLLEAGAARLSLVEGAELVCQAATGRLSPALGSRRPLGEGFEGLVLDAAEGLLMADWGTVEGAGSDEAWIRSLVAVPLRRTDQVVGVLTVADEAPGRFAEADRQALLRFAIHATAALTELRLHAEAERHVAEGRLTTQVAAAFAAARSTPALRRSIATELRRALGADGARLTEEVQGHPAVTATDGELPSLEAPPLPGRRLLCGHTLPDGELAHRCALPDASGFLLAMPLGQVTDHPGCVQLVRRDRPFARHDEELLRRLLEIAELALLTRLANVRVSQYADRIRSVAEVSASLHQSLRPEDAMGQAAEVLRRALNADRVRIGLVDEARREFRFPVWRSGAGVEDGVRRPLGTGLLEEVWRSGRTWFFAERAGEEAAISGFALDLPAASLAAVPLRTRGAVSGVVTMEDPENNRFGPEDVRILEIVAQQLGVTLENLERLEEERRQRITAEWLRQMARTATDPNAQSFQVFECAAEAAYQGVGGLAAMVDVLPIEGGRVTAVVRGTPPAGLLDTSPLVGTVAGWMLEEQGPVFLSPDASTDARLRPEARQAFGAVAVLAVPVFCEHRVVAMVKLLRPAGQSFTMAEVERLMQIADHAGAGHQTARAAEGLRKSEERYRGLFAAATDAIVTLDSFGRITSMNPAAERLWQLHAGRAVGGHWKTLLPLESPAEFEGELSRILAGESGNVELAFRRADGDRGIAALNLAPFADDLGRPAVLAVARDVTAKRRLAAQLVQAEKMSAIGQLVGGMAHEVNNPLASILVYLELLLAETPDSPQAETLRSIKAETDRAARIVRQLLTYVRSQDATRAALDLREPVRDAVALRRHQLTGQEITLHLELPPEPVPVLGHLANLQQVVTNLVANAEQALRNTGRGGTVWVRLRPVGTHAELTVEDDGPGIPPALLTRVFDPFYSTRPEGEGSGLGLSVGAGIIADHGGRISAGERPGGGACLTVELPLRSEGGSAPSPEVPVAPARPSGPARRGRILLIDDEPDIRRSISRYLTRTGWIVEVADSGEEGLRQLATSAFDVVLCDLRMPGMSGHEFFRRLEARHDPAVARLGFMTGDVVSPEASRFLQEAGRPVVSKPFTLDDLEVLLAQLVPTG
jgi:two-component system NtrC family sensor kinase